ncbi:MAG TPA: prephenate dehydrogenase/arogenate dehydrogenase family protein [Acidimicrobiales bacterium]|nr:prephenate dehydrogenase/arogenate dehydrogenase family protein [Acidimicrobiales bacterium]
MSGSPPIGGAPRRALVVGTGLIGGSLGTGLRRRGWHVTGRDADAGRALRALEVGAVDELGEGLDAELVFVATPVAAVPAVASAILAEADRPDTVVVTDVSGVKVPVVEAVRHPRFIGGHPMAGSEQSGIEGADPDLFVGATWVLTPTVETDPVAFALLSSVVAELGADVIALPAADHDRLVAVVSHVPHLVAATLMNAAAEGAKADGALLRLAAGGFRDMTRVAAGQPSIWPDICADNADAIVTGLDRLLDDLASLRDKVAGGDRPGLLELLQRASTARRELPTSATRPERLAELRVPVPDRQGVLAEFTGLAADLGVNIYDLDIAHSAEGPRGVLTLVVGADEADALRKAIDERGHSCTVIPLS